MLANLYISNSTTTIIKIYKGHGVEEHQFDTFDKAIDSMVWNGFKLKSVTEDDKVGLYSYWFEK